MTLPTPSGRAPAIDAFFTKPAESTKPASPPAASHTASATSNPVHDAVQIADENEEDNHATAPPHPSKELAKNLVSGLHHDDAADGAWVKQTFADPSQGMQKLSTTAENDIQAQTGTNPFSNQTDMRAMTDLEARLATEPGNKYGLSSKDLSSANALVAADGALTEDQAKYDQGTGA